MHFFSGRKHLALHHIGAVHKHGTGGHGTSALFFWGHDFVCAAGRTSVHCHAWHRSCHWATIHFREEWVHEHTLHTGFHWRMHHFFTRFDVWSLKSAFTTMSHHRHFVLKTHSAHHAVAHHFHWVHWHILHWSRIHHRITAVVVHHYFATIIHSPTVHHLFHKFHRIHHHGIFLFAHILTHIHNVFFIDLFHHAAHIHEHHSFSRLFTFFAWRRGGTIEASFHQTFHHVFIIFHERTHHRETRWVN